MIKAVIFDYGGVMDNGVPIPTEIAGVYNMPIEEFLKFGDLTIPIFNVLNKGIISERKFWEKISVSIQKPLPKNWKNLSHEIYEKSLFLVPEMINLVKELNNKKIKTAVLSNIARFQAKIIKKHHGYDEFNIKILSYKVRMRKPEQEIYNLVIKKLKTRPEECIFIDDKERNLIPAKNLGIRTILAKNTEQIINDVNSIIESQNEKSI